MSQSLPETKSVFLPVEMIALLAFVVIVLILIFVLWPETGGGWVSGLRSFINAIRI